MKIKRADDKPMVIHTKKKAKIHTHRAKEAAIKGSNVYTVDRTPKIAGKNAADIDETQKKRQIHNPQRHRNSKAYDVRRGNGVFRVMEAYRQSGASIKVRDQSLHIAGAAVKGGAGAAANQLDGGQEVQQALGVAYELSRPAVGTASRGAALFKRQVAEQRKKRIKKVDAGKKFAKRFSKKAASEGVKTATKEGVKLAMKKTAKTSAKSATKAAVSGTATAAGSVGGPAGMAIGYAAGKAVGAKIEHDDRVRTNSIRKIKFFLDKTKDEEHQKDSASKLAKDLVARRISEWIRVHSGSIIAVLLIGILGILVMMTPVIATVGVLYNSPFAVFMPPLEEGDTVLTVTTEYVNAFNQEVKETASNHDGADEGEIVYVDYEGIQSVPSNYYDIIAVYMVRYGIGDTAVIMNDTTKAWLKGVVDDMCSYTTSTETKEVDDGNGGTDTKKVLCVNVRLKTYREMIDEYGFDDDRVALLEEMMKPDNMAVIGYSGGNATGSSGGGNSVCELSEEEIDAILAGITDPTQRAVCSYALHRVGYPYSQALRDSGAYYDCSSLAYYSWKSAGVDISHGGATTAAAEAQGLDEAGKTVSFSEMQPGDLIFYSYTHNGRYKNISHVAVYVGNGKLVEAQNEQNGVVYRDARNSGSIVLIGRP